MTEAAAIAVAPDAPFFIVLNAGSGRDDAAARQATIEGVLDAAGRRHEVHRVDDPKRLQQVAQDTVARARGAGGVVVVAGGDGTINTVAAATHGSGCALGILPQGTFNYFGRTHGIPQDTEQATRLLLAARAEPVQVGFVNGRLFLVNASLGLYPQLLEDRETYKSRFGRSRPVAMLAALVTLLRQRRQLDLRIEAADGTTTTLHTPTLFVGNNPLQLEQIGIAHAEAIGRGLLAGIVLKPVGTGAMLWLLARGAFGSLGDADNVDSFAFHRIAVEPASAGRRRHVKCATDGEVVWLDAPIVFSVGDEPLWLLKAEPGSGLEAAPS